MNRKYFAIALIFLIGYTTYSQKNYKNGYVINMKMDTIYGKLKILTKEASCFKIKFLDKKGEKVKFKTKDVFAYKRGDAIYYKKPYERPVTIGKAKGYMKLVEDGYVKLFRFNYVVKNQGIPGSKGAPTVGMSQGVENFYLERDGKLTFVKTMSFKKSMMKYFSDNQDLVNKIKNKKLRYKNLKEIVQIYNRSKE